MAKNEAQAKANKAWRERNPEEFRRLRKRTMARTFVRHDASISDLIDLIELFAENNKKYDFKSVIETMRQMVENNN